MSTFNVILYLSNNKMEILHAKINRSLNNYIFIPILFNLIYTFYHNISLCLYKIVILQFRLQRKGDLYVS